MTTHNKIHGCAAEDFARKFFDENDLSYRYVDDFYDFSVETQMLEVKSCQLSIKDRKGVFRVGRFDFTNKDARERLAQHDAWILLLVRHEEQMLLYGFIKASKIKSRYLAIHQARSLKPLNTIQWITKVKKI